MEAATAMVRLRVSVDVILFTVADNRLQLLLRRESDDRPWALPGAPLDRDAALELTALGALEHQTGIRGVYLEQLYTFAPPSDSDGERVVRVAYYALAPVERLQAEHESIRWVDVEQLPELPAPMDHMIAVAHERLAAKLEYTTVAFQMMPAEFTLSQLQEVYEIIGREPLDKRNFRKQILGSGRVEATGGMHRSGSHRPARLYRLKHPHRVEIIK